MVFGSRENERESNRNVKYELQVLSSHEIEAIKEGQDESSEVKAQKTYLDKRPSMLCSKKSLKNNSRNNENLKNIFKCDCDSFIVKYFH